MENIHVEEIGRVHINVEQGIPTEIYSLESKANTISRI